MRILTTIISVIMISTVFIYAGVGLLFIHATDRTPSDVSTCDVIKRIDDTLYCMGIMDDEDDNISILRGE